MWESHKSGPDLSANCPIEFGKPNVCRGIESPLPDPLAAITRQLESFNTKEPIKDRILELYREYGTAMIDVERETLVIFNPSIPYGLSDRLQKIPIHDIKSIDIINEGMESVITITLSNNQKKVIRLGGVILE